MLRRYGIATAAILAAIAARYALQPWLGTTFPLATVFTAIAFTVWRAGWGPALFTTVVGWASVIVAFRGGSNFVGGLTINELVGFLTYLIATVPIIVLGEAMRRAHRTLEERHEELSTTNLELENKVEAQSLLAAIIASSEDAIVSKTLDGIITSWNRGAERLFGWKADEVIGKSIHIIVPEEMRDQEQHILEQLRQGERVEHLDIERVRKDGSRVHVSVTISPVYDRHGHIIGASKMARDITTRKMWEAGIVRSEEAQRLLVGIHDATRGLSDPTIVMREIVTRVGIHFDVIRCAYGEIGEDQRELVVSPGYTKGLQTVAGRYPLDTFGPRLASELRAGRTIAIEDVRRDALTDTAKAQETYAAMQIVSMIVSPLVRSGRLVAILVVADDHPRAWTLQESTLLEQIAERTLFAVEGARAAAALRENRDVLSQAMTAGRMGAWRRDLLNDSMWWSPELADILGFDRDAPAPPIEQIYQRCHPDDRPMLVKAVEDAIANHSEIAVTFRFRKTGSDAWGWMEVKGKALYGVDGKAQVLSGLGIDVTERQRAVEALKEADRRKDEFLATLAHELRNPLAPINSGLHILRHAANPAQIATALEIMERQVGQMVRLVDDLLDVARITTGKVELRCETIDLADAIRDAAETCAPELARRGDALTIHGPAAPIYVNADRTRLAQVFANLLNNSVKYTEAGQPVSITFGREGREAVVRVRDGGMGIHPDMLPRVFEMFRQADNTGGRSRGGLGIGLSLVKRIAELHGGTVTASSEGLGLGSEFVVRIPALDSQRVDKDDTRSAAAGHASRRKILVVDDNADAAESLAALLSISGHDTRMAHDGPDALQQAERFNPDIVFLDIGMPTLDGHETARLIRQQPWGKEMVLVALTGWGQSEDRRRSKEAGFDHHLVKPADPAVVQKLLASI